MKKTYRPCAKYSMSLFAICGLAFASTAMAQDEMYMRPGYAKQYETPKPFATMMVADPKVVDGLAATDRLVTLTPQGLGETNVLFLDSNGREVSELIVYVGKPGRLIEIHNHPKLHGTTNYRCTEEHGCRYESETHYELPTQRIINENINR
jgi:Flp pilus assembly secretin CpaC